MAQSSILLQGREFRLAPLNLADLRRLESVLLGAGEEAARGFTSMLSLVPVVHAALSKMHPEVALEDLEQMLDLESFPHALDRVLEISGLKRKAAGESGPAAA